VTGLSPIPGASGSRTSVEDWIGVAITVRTQTREPQRGHAHF
jgi:hypothetical protein